MVAQIAEAVARLFDTPLYRLPELTIGQMIILVVIASALSALWRPRW